MFFAFMRRLISACLLVLLSTNVFHASDMRSTHSVATRFVKNNMRAFAWEEEEWPNERFEPYVRRVLQYQEAMQPFRKRKCALDILQRFQKALEEKTVPVLTDIVTWNDLMLFHGDEVGSAHLASIVERTSTEMGRVILASWMAHPELDINLLIRRQNCAKRFLNDAALFEAIDEQLEVCRQSENLLLAFWIPDQFAHVSERNYFGSAYLNSSEMALGVKNAYDHALRASFLGTSLCAACILPLHGLKRLYGSKEYAPFDRLSERLIGVGTGAPGAMLSMINNQYVQGGTSIASGVYCGMIVQDAYEWMRGNFVLSICMQKKMIHVGRVVDALHALHALVESEGLDKYLHHAHLLRDFCESADEKLMHLKALLESNTFNGEPSVLAHYGRILAAYKCMSDIKELFEPALIALGEIDAHLSLARLYKQYEHERVRYSFVEYIADAEQPHVELTDFWNPFVDVEKVVTNSLSLGIEKPRNIIMTGPNAGGKSTTIKAVAMNIIMAQTLGIAAATSMRMTPFAYIATYLNIIDDIASGKSLFKAQVARAKEIMSHADSLPHNQFSFLVIDEMFNGTDVRAGQALSYSVVKKLGESENCIIILATHFPLLTQLGEQKNFANYRVLSSRDASGKIVYPFLIEPGTSEHNIALDMAQQEGFDEDILAQAHALLK